MSSVDVSPATGLTNDQHAEFAAFYLEHAHRCHQVAMARTGGNRPLAEDIVQDTMVTVFYVWDRVRSTARPAAYLYKVLTNRIIDHYRRNAREAVADLKSIENMPSYDHQPDESAQVIERIRELPSRQREVLMLRAGGWGYSEIAEMLQMPAASVRSNVRHARLRLQSALREDEDPERNFEHHPVPPRTTHR